MLFLFFFLMGFSGLSCIFETLVMFKSAMAGISLIRPSELLECTEDAPLNAWSPPLLNIGNGFELHINMSS